jgi:Fe-S cluster biogenesis protein NfuA
MVRDSTITVAKNVPTPWQHMAAEIAQAIRTGLSSGGPPIAQEVIDELANAPIEGMEEAIAELFDEQINPALAAHGGFVKLVKIEDRDVYLEMGGGCQGCSASRATLRYGVEGAIRRIAPNVRNIVDVTDHAAGVNPYYK